MDRGFMEFMKRFSQSKPEMYHPGFDPGGSSALYDLIREDGSPVDFSLYDWKSKKL